MAIITLADLADIRSQNRKDVIVFCSGSFDLTHVGHLVFFECCKALGSMLVVMVACDAILRDRKGSSRPILDEMARVKMVDGLKPVDYAFLDHHPIESGNEAIPETRRLLLPLMRVLDELEPDYYAINSDAFDIDFRKQILSSRMTKLVILDKKSQLYGPFTGISTTYLVEKIRLCAP